MKFLIIGLGSMGKRRIRNLKALGLESNQIFGYDIRKDRLIEAESKYGINIKESLDEEIWNSVDGVIISTPPDKHLEYLWYAARQKLPIFVEASVILEGLEEFRNFVQEKGILVAPSCTMRFHPSIRTIKKIVSSKKYGKVTSFYYISGQYLPDWHPWENIKDYYVSQKETGGCREIVPYELTWMVDVFGFPQEISGFYEKTSDLDTHIDDVYVINLKYKDFLGSLNVDVVARHATRFFVLNLQRGQLLWDWNTKQIRFYDADEKRWIVYHEPEGTSVEGYEKNIIEEMYINELQAFIRSITTGDPFPNTLEDDIKVLTLLTLIEKSKKGIKV
ncbi:MAG: Gfo/Idh/MocA family protein [Promethearchaeota archaeon]